MSDQNPSERADNKHHLPIHRPTDDVARHDKLTRPRVRHSAQPKTEEGFSPAIVLRVFQQWWRWVLPAGLLLSIAVGAIVIKFHVPLYKSMAMIMIEATEPYIAFSDQPSQRTGGRFIATQIELIRSDLVLAPVLALPEVARLDEFKKTTEPLAHLRKNLKIEQVGKSNFYHVLYVSRSPQAAATVANAVVAEYINEQSDVEYQQAQRVISLLDEEKRQQFREIERLRTRVVEMAKELTGKDPFGQGAITDFDRAYSPTAELYQNLISNDVQIELLKAEIQSQKETPLFFPEESESSLLTDFEISGDRKVQQVKAELQVLEDQIELFKKGRRNWETHEDYLDLQKEFEESTAELATVTEEAHGRLLEIKKLNAESTYNESIAAKERQLSRLLLQKEMWSKRFEESISELKAGGAQSVQLQFAKAELARKDRVYELIAARKLQLQTELRAPPRVTPKLRAKAASAPIELVPIKILLVACTASMLFPFGLVLLKEIMARKIVGTEQLHQVAQVPILGEIARFPVRPVAKGPRALPRRQQREMFIFAESVDSLRTNLMLTESLGAPGKQHVIAIASAASGEGKTSVATSLAVSIAGATKKPTLIVDADLRSPDVAQVLGVSDSPGLSDVLTGKQALSDAIQPSGEPNTYVLPAGRTKSNPHHVIDGAKVGKLFDSLRGKFATIIIDTPPVLGASEALVYANAADLVLFCSLNDVSRAKQVHAGIHRLQSTGADVAGAVLSGISSHRYAYSYGVYGDDET